MGITSLLRRAAGRRALSAAVSLSRGEMPATLLPARPSTMRSVPVNEAMTLGAVYRAVDILSTAVGQLGIEVYRQGTPVPAGARPAVVRNPSLHIDRRTFIEQTVLSMATHGDFFWFRQDFPGGLTTLDVLDPREVFVQLYQDGHRTFHWRGVEYTDMNIVHRGYLMPAGAAHGLGPVQAAQAELRGAIDVRDYAAAWFDSTGQPAGVLESDQALTAAEAKLYRDTWNGLDAEGNAVPDSANPSRIKVTGKGLNYRPILLSPRDASWVEARNLSVVEVARMFGVPAGMLLASVESNAQTYANIEQSWTEFDRFTLSKYLGKIEDALSDVAGAGLTVRFNVETLLRSDTKTRYESHSLALTAGWMTVDEVRAIEGMPAFTDTQRRALAPADSTAAGLDLAGLVQKIYLGVPSVISADEARRLLALNGFPLDAEPAYTPAIEPAPASQESTPWT